MEMMSKNEFFEAPTYLEITMLQMRKEKLKHKHKCLHKSMLTKINMFDDHLLTLYTLRKDVNLSITFLNLFASTLEEELIILNNFDLLEDEYSHNVYLKTIKQTDKVNEVKYFNELLLNTTLIFELT